MPSTPSDSQPSILLVEECFDSEHAGFVDAIRALRNSRWLAAFADRWKRDTRPWARAQVLAYLQRPLDCPGHQPVVKRLFKDAEARKDPELMAAFTAAFDVLVRRQRIKRWTWDRTIRSAITNEVLATPRNVIPLELPYLTAKRAEEAAAAKLTAQKRARQPALPTQQRVVRNGRLFTFRTRYYLRRRAWRFFRRLGYGQPDAYPAAITHVLQRYRDVDLATGENILDSWVLLNACFRTSDALDFRPEHVRLKEGRSLAELKAAPRFPQAWETPEAAKVLLDLATTAQAHLVRMWSIEMVRMVRSKRPEVIAALTPQDFLRLCNHEDDAVQELGAELLESSPNLDKWLVADWLVLMACSSMTALSAICGAFRRHVSPGRLTLAQCVALACAAAVPVARLGLDLLRQRTIASDELPTLVGLADARCPALGSELTSWALELLGHAGVYRVDVVSRFFDSLLLETREAAWAWLTTPDAASAYRDPVLWSRLVETPFSDLRLRLVDVLSHRVKTPALATNALEWLWCSVLLGIHQGGRQKVRAVAQVADAIRRDPALAPRLLPVLSVAVRSIRGPEMRAGLAALMALVTARPELEPAIRVHLPELGRVGEEVRA